MSDTFVSYQTEDTISEENQEKKPETQTKKLTIAPLRTCECPQ